MKYLILSLLLSLLISCADSKGEGAGKFSGEVDEMYCFSGEFDDENYLLRIYVEGEEIVGIMEFFLSNNDKKEGTFEGILVGDTIFADLSIQHQDLFLRREVAFLMTSTGLEEGKAEMTESEGKMIFKNHSDLSFGQDLILKPIDCSNIKK